MTALEIIGGVLALASLIVAFRMLQRKRLIDDMPTSKTQGVFIGFVELKGTAESETPLSSHLAGIPCVQFSWHVDEQSTETHVETYADSKGQTHTRTVTTTKWTTVASGGEAYPFFLRDDTGIIRVVPDNAKIEGKDVFDRTCGPADPLYFGKGPMREVPHSDHRRRFCESALPLHSPIFVIGQSRERVDIVAPEMAYDKRAPMFLISTRTEKQVVSGYRLWFWLPTILGMGLAVGSVALDVSLRSNYIGATWQPCVFAGVMFLLATVIGWAWTVYNSLVNLRQRVGQAWSAIDVQLKMRKDLIPNLTRVVEGYSSHEKNVQVTVAAMRCQLEATPPGTPGPDLKGFAPAIRLIMEKYPDLKANELFLKLQQSLSDTEQRIALARDYFNQIAAFYNIRLLIIPDRFVAALARLRPQQFLAASDFERAEVEVKLAE